MFYRLNIELVMQQLFSSSNNQLLNLFFWGQLEKLIGDDVENLLMLTDRLLVNRFEGREYTRAYGVVSPSRRIFVYTFCLIDVCWSLSDDANKVETLNIERA